MLCTCILREEDGERGLTREWVLSEVADHVVEIPIRIAIADGYTLRLTLRRPKSLLVGVREDSTWHRSLVLPVPPGPVHVLEAGVRGLTPDALLEVILRPREVRLNHVLCFLD